jgi:hypothetical protein
MGAGGAFPLPCSVCLKRPWGEWEKVARELAKIARELRRISIQCKSLSFEIQTVKRNKSH